MASNVVRVSVQADSSQLQTAFDQGATSAEKFKAKMGLVAKAVVAALAIKALGAVKDFVGDSVRAFSDLNESLNAVEVTYGRNADGIKKLGEQSARSLGLSNAEFNSFAVSIAAFAEQIAGPGGDIVGVVDTLTKRVTDFASVMNLDVAEAQEKFQSGLAGQSRPLREFGIDVSDARVKAFALANGIGEAGKELTEAEKVTARYGTIMEQTAKVQGDFANTAEDYANAQRIANAEMENAKARAGEALVPFAQLTGQLKLAGAQAIGVFSTQLLQLTGSIDAVNSHIQQFEIHMGRSADSAAAALTIVREYGGTFDELIPRLDLSREELTKLREADEDWLRSMGFTEEQVRDLAGAVSKELASAMTIGEEKARELQRSEFDLQSQVEDTTESIEEQAEAAAEAAEKSRDEFRKLAEAAAAEFEKAEGSLNDFINGFETLPEKQKITLQEWIKNFNARLVEIEQWYKDLNILRANGMAEFANEMERAGYEASHGLVTEARKTIGTEFGGLLEDTAKNGREVGERLATGIAGGITAYAGEIGEAAEAAVRAAVARAKKAAGVESPSKLMAEEVGKPLAEGVAMGIEQSTAPAKAAESMISSVARPTNGHGGGQGSPIHITVNALDPQAAANAVVQALQTYQRGNGAIPIQTR